MPDPFFTKLAESGWRVPAKQRIAYLVVGQDAVPGGGVRIKIRGLPSGLGVAEWQLRLHPAVIGRQGHRPIDSRYVSAKTLDGALAAATAEAERIVEKFRARAAHVQHAPQRIVETSQPAHVQRDEGTIVDHRQPNLDLGQQVRNAYRLGKRTATVVLDGDLHERLKAASVDTGKSIQALLVEGAGMVLAHLQEGRPPRTG